MREPSQILAMMEKVMESPLDILVNNAGVQVTAPLAEMPRSSWDDIIAINLSAAFDTMRLALPAMAQRGYGRVAPSEIARLVTWLCDPVAHNMTGTAIPVDGGWTAQ